MKKVTLICLFLVSATINFAQSQIGLQIGGDLSYQRNSVSQAQKNSSKLGGFVIGAVSDIKLQNNWYFRPEFNYIQKGFVVKGTENEVRGSLYYLEVPMNLTYNMKTSLGKVFIGAGPSLGYGVYGKVTEAGNTFYARFDGRNEGYHYKRFDFGLNFILGYQFNSGSFFSAGYNNGLTDVDTNIGDNSELRNKYFFLKIGYMIKKKK